MYNLKGKVVVVTGSGRGIGKEIALVAATEGAKLVINAKKGREEMEKTVQEIRETGGEAIGVLADVSSENGCNDIFHQTENSLGKVDVLINNAGVGIYSPIAEVDEKIMEKHFQTDFKSVLYCSKAGASRISDGGEILNVASLAGILPFKGLSIYGAMKGAVITLTRYLALELAPRIRVNAVAPGLVKTRMGESLPKVWGMTEEEYAQKFTLSGRILDPRDVAQLVISMLKVEGMTGQVIVIDSGESLMGSVGIF
ncbi:SDR family oxidoreductase [Metallosphaera tengchongensis]|uniref:SDR family oxidoreductase n=1 Tax=Metallosphaera tengchongensis TaxID=1532350 RepID=A0A6N0NVB4_9CREN|nr:SDR family oxidoreductase [Metallosphaera tengchongensis]QKR00814.1 SDR family oxidoreductase [Metallosphaera tengchongensis]